MGNQNSYRRRDPEPRSVGQPGNLCLGAPPIFDLTFGVQVALVAAIGAASLFAIGWYCGDRIDAIRMLIATRNAPPRPALAYRVRLSRRNLAQARPFMRLAGLQGPER
jgi:hypothetical protein